MKNRREVMPMELLSAPYSVLFMIVFVLLTLILLSWGYYSYIRSAERKEKYVYIAYLAPLIAILTIFSWSLYACLLYTSPSPRDS